MEAFTSDIEDIGFTYWECVSKMRVSRVRLCFSTGLAGTTSSVGAGGRKLPNQRVELGPSGWACATHLELQPAPTQATSKAHAGLCPKITREFFRYLKQRNSSAGGGKLLPRSPPRHERARAAVCRGRGFCVTEVHGNLAAYQGPRSFPQVGGCARGARVPQTAEFSLRDPRPGLALQSSSW